MVTRGEQQQIKSNIFLQKKKRLHPNKIENKKDIALSSLKRIPYHQFQNVHTGLYLVGVWSNLNTIMTPNFIKNVHTLNTYTYRAHTHTYKNFKNIMTLIFVIFNSQKNIKKLYTKHTQRTLNQLQATKVQMHV